MRYLHIKNYSNQMHVNRPSFSLFLLYLFILIGVFHTVQLPGQENNYQHSVEKILKFDTELNSSDVSTIRYTIINSDSLFTSAISLKNSPTIAIDSAIRFNNTLSVFPIYAYLCLRKYCDSTLSQSQNIKIGASSEWTDLALHQVVLQQSKLPKHPLRPDHFPLNYSIYDLSISELKTLLSYQQPQEQCSVSELNTLIAVHYIDSLVSNCSDIRKDDFLDKATFAKAKEGRITYRAISQISHFILNNLNQLRPNECNTSLNGYEMNSGFYTTSVKENYRLFMMTGRTEVGRCFIGLVPSTKTGVVLLSDQEDKEIIDFGYLILRMLNNNWKR